MKNNINLISIIKEIITEQNAPQTYKYTRTNPLKINKDPYVYAYEGPNNLWVRNTRKNKDWINISQGVQAGYPKYAEYEADIVNDFGLILGIPTTNKNTATNIQAKEPTFVNNYSTNFSQINQNMLPSVKPNINPEFSYCYNVKLNPNKSNILNKKYNKKECAQFVNEFSLDFGGFLAAWMAHDNEELGTRVWSAFENIPQNKIAEIIELFIEINKNFGGKDKGAYNDKVKTLVNSLVPQNCPVPLMLGDVIGIFYPESGHHEEAFMQAGYKYFLDKNGTKIKIDEKGKIPKGILGTNITPGNTIKTGKGWGMNTHIGIVGDVQNNVPYIYHNIGYSKYPPKGVIYADPPNHLIDGGRIAWVKRNKIDANIKPTQITNKPINIQPLPQLNLTAKLQNNQPK
jgi:hypothetical protein